MSNEAIELQPEAVVSVEPISTPVEVPAPEVKRYKYQPKDERGRDLGGEQVILYTTSEELAEKLVEQNTLLLRRLRAETRKNRLGLVDSESIPQDAPRYEEPLDFAPKSLSDEERVALSRNLLDPERFEEASDALFEAKLGVKPDLFRKRMAEMQEDSLRSKARYEADAFVAANPDYVKCQENLEAITNWMMRYKLAPVRQNFQEAYNVLKASGVLIQNYNDTQEAQSTVDNTPATAVEPVKVDEPIVESQPVVVETIVEPVVEPKIEVSPTPIESPKPSPRIPTGFNRSNSDDTGTVRPVGDDIVYEVVSNGQKKRFTGLAAIHAMPADEYKRRTLTDPSFSKKEAQLEKEAAERRRASRR